MSNRSWELSPGRTVRRRRGFTAVELTAVATIIALLALVLIPIVRKRVAQSRILAAQDDMRTIQIAETLARADTGFYFRLSDLDNRPADGTDVDTIPNTFWNEPVAINLQANLARNWTGPYTIFNDGKSRPLSELVVERPEMFRALPSSSGTQAVDGPILIFTAADPDNDLLNDEHTPIDPWGSPYIFFGDTVFGPNAGNIAVNETNFRVATVYSMGPDGLPGDALAFGGLVPASSFFYPQSGVLGTSDDLSRTF